MLKGINANILSLVIAILLSQNSYAELYSETGEFKVHEDKCYKQIYKSSSKQTSWEEFDCISFLKDVHLNEQILSLLSGYHQMVGPGFVSKEAFSEITLAAMSAMSQKTYFNTGTILENFKNAANEAQQKYPASKTFNK